MPRPAAAARPDAGREHRRLVALGIPAGLAAVVLAGWELRFVLAALLALAGLSGCLVLARLGWLRRILILTLAAGLTVSVSISPLQHTMSPGHYVANVGGAGGITLSLPFLAACLLAVTRARQPPARSGQALIVVPVLAFMAAGLVSLLNAGDPALVWLEELRLAQLLFLCLTVSRFDRDDLAWLLVALAVGVGLQAALAAMQVLFDASLGLGFLGDGGTAQEAIGFDTRSRATGFKGNPNILAYFFEMLYPLCLALALSRAGTVLRLAGGFGAACALAGLVLTLSRGGWLTVPVSTGLVLALVYRDRLRTAAGLLSLAGMAAIVLPGMILAGPTIIDRLTADDAGSLAQRAPLNAGALSVIEQFPVAGVGLNNFANMFPIYDRTGAARIFIGVNHVVHNLYFLVWTETGTLGLVAFLSIFVGAAAAARRCACRNPTGSFAAACAIGACIGLLAQLMHGMVDPGFRLNLGASELVFVSLGIIAASGRPSQGGYADEDGHCIAPDRGKPASG